MKILICLLISFSGFAQLSDIQLKTHTVNGSTITTIDSVKRIWKNHRDVTPKHGMIYDYRLGDDTARYFHNIPGKNMRARVLFYDEALGVPDGEPIPEPPVAQIDTIDSEALVYEGWARHGATSTPGWYKGTISYSSTGEARYTFVGTGVEVWGETGNHGEGSVTVGGQTKAASWKSDVRKLPAKIVEFKGLPQGQHTVTIKPVSGTILIDFIVLIR